MHFLISKLVIFTFGDNATTSVEVESIGKMKGKMVMG